MATIRFIYAPTNGYNDIVGSNGPDTISGQAVHYDINGCANADRLKCNDVIILQEEKWRYGAW